MYASLLTARLFRLCAFLILSVIFFITIYFNIILYNRLYNQYPIIQSVFQQPPVLLLLFTVFFVLIFPYFRNLSKVSLDLSNEKTDRIKELIQEISASFSVKAPQVKILEHVNPTAFTLKTGFNNYTIYLTNGLLNLIAENELKVVLSHEIAHIHSGFTSVFKNINYLLFILKLSSIFTFFLILAVFNILFPFTWFILILPFVFIRLWDKNESSPAFSSGLIRYIVPTYILIDLFSILIFKLISINEEYMADLKSFLLMENRDAVHSMFQKIREYPGPYADLPRKFKPLYFLVEKVRRV